MMISRVLLDMDGVCSNFFDAACRVHDFDTAKYPVGQWEMAPAIGITEDEFWGVLQNDKEFWLNLEPYPWLKELVAWLDNLEHHRKIKWWVATSPNRDPMCLAHKSMWLCKHLGHKAGQAMLGRDKWLMANAQTLLIDDGEHNTDAFLLNGGHAVLWPAIWNRYYECDTPLINVKSQVMDLLDNGAKCDNFGCTAAYYDARARQIAKMGVGSKS